MKKNPYQTLGVPRDADAATIRKAVRRRRAKAHPDRTGKETEEIREINQAARILLLPDLRARFDRGGHTEGPPPPSPDAHAHSCIATVLMQIMDLVPDHLNLLAELRQQIDKVRNALEGAPQQIAARRGKLEKRAKRFSVKRGKAPSVDIFQSFFSHQIEQLRAAEQKAAEDLAAAIRALEILEHFEFQPEASTMNEAIRTFTTYFKLG